MVNSGEVGAIAQGSVDPLYCRELTSTSWGRNKEREKIVKKMVNKLSKYCQNLSDFYSFWRLVNEYG